MTILCYSQRPLNPFRRSICCIQHRSAEAVTADGLNRDIYVSNEALLADLPPRPPLPGLRHPLWQLDGENRPEARPAVSRGRLSRAGGDGRGGL